MVDQDKEKPLAAWSETVSASVRAALDGRDILHFPGSSEFADSESAYFTAAAAEVRSAAVARPTSTADVSALLKALRQTLPADVPIAVRGAGHATYGGMAKAASGLTIDMRGLRGVDVLSGGKTVRIGAGEHWGYVSFSCCLFLFWLLPQCFSTAFYLWNRLLRVITIHGLKNMCPTTCHVQQ